MKNKSFKLSALSMAVTISHAVLATNTVDSGFTGTKILSGDNNSNGS